MSTSLYFLRRQKITPSGSCFRQLRPLRPTGKNLLQQLINTITPVLYYHNRGWINQGSTAPCRCIFRPVYVNYISYFNLAIAMYTGTIQQRVPCSCKRAGCRAITAPCRSICRPIYVNCINSSFNLAITMYTGTIRCRVAGSYKRAIKSRAIKSTKHRAEPTAISHQPSAIKSRKQRPSTLAKHQAPSTSTQNTSTHHPSPSTSKQAPITTYGYIPLFAVFGSVPLFSFRSFC